VTLTQVDSLGRLGRASIDRIFQNYMKPWIGVKGRRSEGVGVRGRLVGTYFLQTSIRRVLKQWNDLYDHNNQLLRVGWVETSFKGAQEVFFHISTYHHRSTALLLSIEACIATDVPLSFTRQLICTNRITKNQLSPHPFSSSLPSPLLTGRHHRNMSSILHTCTLPSFSSTHELILLSHHLISLPLSYASSFPSHSLLLSTPPSLPYTSSLSSRDITERPRKKRRKGAVEPSLKTPLQHASDRAAAFKRSTTEVSTEVYHRSIELGLQSALDGLGEWEGEYSGGDGGGKVEWRDRTEEKEREGREVRWANLGEEREEKEVLRIGEEEVGFEQLGGRIVWNWGIEESVVECDIPLRGTGEVDVDGVEEGTAVSTSTSPPPTKVTLVLPPSSAFLLSSFSTWCLPTSNLPSFGAEIGGWDLMILESVSSPPLSSFQILTIDSIVLHGPIAQPRTLRAVTIPSILTTCGS
jgi:hypothetical protein